MKMLLLIYLTVGATYVIYKSFRDFKSMMVMELILVTVMVLFWPVAVIITYADEYEAYLTSKQTRNGFEKWLISKPFSNER
jgi:hypothetical protein